MSRTASLPPPLRHLRKDVPKTFAAATNAQLRIAFPPEGARVDLGLAAAAPPAARLTLKAEGGVLPLRWIVNGVPLGEPDLRRQAAWTPDGAGFARVSSLTHKARRTAWWCGWNRSAFFVVSFRGGCGGPPRWRQCASMAASVVRHDRHARGRGRSYTTEASPSVRARETPVEAAVRLSAGSSRGTITLYAVPVISMQRHVEGRCGMEFGPLKVS